MTELSEADLRAAEPGTIVKVAAAAQALTGLFIALCGLQIVDVHFYAHPILRFLPYLLMGGGALQIAIAAYVYGRGDGPRSRASRTAR